MLWLDESLEFSLELSELIDEDDELTGVGVGGV